MGSETTKSECSILDLPNEILSFLFGYVPQNNLLESRLVSKDWKTKIDELANYHFRFDDTLCQEVVQNALQLRLRSCEFLGLQNNFSVDFRNPNLIKEVLFGNRASSENVTSILSTCLDMEKLTFYTTLSKDNMFSPTEDYSPMFNRLKKLKELDIGIQCFRKRVQGDNSSIFNSLVCNPGLVFPSLRRFSVNFPLLYREWLQLFEFLARHGSTLKSVKLRCFRCSNMEIVPDALISDLQSSVSRLNTFSVICDRSCDDGSSIHGVFTSLFSAQKSLETVNLDYGKVPLDEVKKVVTRCQKSLQSAQFYTIEVGNEPEYWMDGQLFSGCDYLRELRLDIYDSQVVYVTFDDPGNPGDIEPRACGTTGMTVWNKNFRASGWGLPRRLQKLSLGSIGVPTDELVNLTTKDHCSNLESLRLINVGSSVPHGLTFTALMEILGNLDHLKELNFRYPCKLKSDIFKWNIFYSISKEMRILKHDNDLFEMYSLERRSFDPCTDPFTLHFECTSQKMCFRERVLHRVAEYMAENTTQDDGLDVTETRKRKWAELEIDDGEEPSPSINHSLVRCDLGFQNQEKH